MKCNLCDRPSCRPSGYAPLCVKHYLAAIKANQEWAAERFRAHVESLRQSESPSASVGSDEEA